MPSKPNAIPVSQRFLNASRYASCLARRTASMIVGLIPGILLNAVAEKTAEAAMA